MDNYKKRMNILKAIILCMFAITIFVTVQFHYGFTGLLVNCGILVIMACMIRYADRCGLRLLNCYADDVNSILKELEKIEDECGNDRETMESRILDLDSFLQHDEVKERFVAYRNAYGKEIQLECNISDYLNYDQLTEKLSLRFCEILPSVLTAMGILGTFLGLTIGLTNFDFSSAETMGASIQSFVSGINIAFYTSIYGIVLSIYMNSFCNSIEERFEEKLIAVENRFDDLGMNRSEQSIWVQLYKEEKLQTDGLQQLNKEFPQNLSDTLGKNLSKSFNLTNSNIQNLMGQIQDRENEAMEHMVQNFLRQLNQGIKSNYETMAKTIDNLEESFHLLGDSVNSLSEWQKDMTEEIRKFVVEVGESNQKMEEITKKNTEQIEQLNGALQEFSSSMEHISHDLEAFYMKEEHLYDKMQHVVEQQDDIAAKLERVVDVYEANGENLKIRSQELQERHHNLEEVEIDLKAYQQECREQLRQMMEIIDELRKEQEQRQEESVHLQKMYIELESLEYKVNHIVDRMSDLSLKSDSQKLAREMLEIRQMMRSEIEQTRQHVLDAIEDTTLKGKFKKVFHKQGEA